MKITFIKAFLLTYIVLVLSMTVAILSLSCSFSILFLQHLGARNLVLKVWADQDL